MSLRDTTHSKPVISMCILMLILLSHMMFTPNFTSAQVEQIMEKNEVLGGVGLEMSWDYKLAQSFNASSDYYLTKVSLYVMDQFPVNDFINVEIWSNDMQDPGDPFDDIPLGPISPLEMNNGIDEEFEWLEFWYSIPLVGGERYWIVAYAEGNLGEGYLWMDSGGNEYPDGFIVRDGGSKWDAEPDNDFLFRVYGERQNDVGVKEIIAPKNQDLYVETEIISVIRNFGLNNQGPVDVNIIINDPFGLEVFNDLQVIPILFSDEELDLFWCFTPNMEGKYTITITTSTAIDDYPQNNVMVFYMDVKAMAVLKLHDEIFIDGFPGEWRGDPGIPDDTWQTSRRELIWRDSFGDDLGDGDYVYPSDFRFEPGCLDLLEFRVAIDSDSINFLLELGSIDDGGGDAEDGTLGFSEQVIQILVDTDRDGTGREDAIRNARLKLDKSNAWEYAIWVDGFENGYIEDESGDVAHDILTVWGNSVTNTIEISVPIIGSAVPDFQRWGYSVLIGAHDLFALPYSVEGSQSGFIDVDEFPSSSSGGGGWDDNGADSNVYDLAFAFPQDPQLDNYNNDDFDLISFTEVPPSSGAFVDANEYWAQSFIAPKTCLLSGVDIYAMDINADSSYMAISIMSNEDMKNLNPDDDVPSGIRISSAEFVDFSRDSYEWGGVSFGFPTVLSEGQTYWIVANGFDLQPDGYHWGRKEGNPFPEGVAARRQGVFWTQQINQDLFFRVYSRELTTVDAYQTVHFAPIVINEAYINGTEDKEWVSLYFNGTNFAPDLDMINWKLMDQDGNAFQFNGFVLGNKKNVTIHTGSGTNSSSDLYWGIIGDVWHDSGDDILLVADFIIPVDYMNYTDGLVFGEPPPFGLNWGPESGESIPKNPKLLQKLYLKDYGLENDLYNDWMIRTIGDFKVKSLYFFDDNTFFESDPYDHMNTQPPKGNVVTDFDSDGNPGLTLKKSGPDTDPRRFQTFNLTPVFAGDFKIVDDIEVELWLDDNGAGDWEAIDVTLLDCNGTDFVEIESVNEIFYSDFSVGWELVSVIIPDIDYNLPRGHYLSLHIMVDANNSTNDLWLAYNTTGEPSGLKTIPTRTYVNVEWARTYDISEVEMTDFDLFEDVLIKANISDPFGSYDITGANITITKPSAPGVPGEIPMTLDITDPDDPSAWKIFKYTFSDTNEPGIYTVRIKGIESNGVVHLLTIFFNVLDNNPPVLTGPSLIPLSGYADEWFNFSVNYSDLDNDPPDIITVNITGHGIYSLIEYDTGDINYTDGKLYYVNLTGFDFGTSYSYLFAANDSKGFWTETADTAGPQILNSPPSLSNPGINFATGNASTIFIYTVTYTDLDNQAPDSITVNISGPSHSGDWVMQEVDSGDTDYTDGKDYRYSYSGFINGSYSYHFAACDSEGVWDETPEDPKPLVLNSLPILMNPQVLPIFGYIDTEFNYTVTYYDLDDHPPASITVNITGPSHSGNWAMIEVDPSDTNYIDGKDYYHTYTGFIIGSYSFHYATNDTQGSWRECTEISLPNILNTPPTLSDHNLLPSVGDPGVTVFNYTVTYTDLDDQAPGKINVTISGPSSGNYSMLELDPSDTDYTDGKEYYFTTILASAGTYSYRFDAYDSGGLWALGIEDSGPSVGQEEPVLSQPQVTPLIGITTTVFNFTINYTDQQNDPAGVIKLNLTGPVSGNFTMLEVDPGDIITSDGKYFYFETASLTKGFYTFIVYGNDSKGNPTVSTRKFRPRVINSLPQLSGGYINESEFGESWFNFTATYLDINNDVPSQMNLNITGLGVFAMIELDPGDTNYIDGKEYYYNITIPKGSYSYHFAARDSGLGANWNETSPEPFTLKNNIPIFNTQDVFPSTGFGGDDFNFTVNIIDRDNEIVTVILYIQDESGSPFTMMELDTLDTDTFDGKFFYFNITLLKGSYNYNFSVFDGDEANQTLVQILTVKNNPPQITSPDITNTNEDDYYTNDYNYVDLDGDGITWALATDATWLNLNPATGEIYGTPNNLNVGNYYVNISVDDGDLGIDFHNFSLSVINTPPVITNTPEEFTWEDLMHLDDFNSVDDGQGTIVYSYLSNATWLGIDSGSGLLSGTPDNTDVGWYWINVSVDDGNGGIFSVNYTLTVNNTPPTILTLPLQIALEDSLHLDDFNCVDDSQGSIVYTLSSNGTWLSLNIISGILSGFPTNSDVGWCWVNVSVTDGNGGLDFLNYSISVFNVNDPPVISTGDVGFALEDTLYSVDYDATDIDPTQDTLTWSMQTNASWLSLNSTTGVLNGTPTNWDIGSYWVDISVSDGKGGWDSSNFTLTVTDENDPPIITTPNIEFATEDSYYEVDYEFIDIDDPTVTWILDSNASWLSIDPATGVLNGTPDNADVGWNWVNVTVDDGRGGIDYANFTITVNNTLPSITTLADEYAQEDVLHWDDFDCDDDLQGNVIYTFMTNASWLMFNSINGVLSGTANNTQIGWYWVNITFYDGNGGVDSVNFTLTVNNTPPLILTVPLMNAVEDILLLDDFNCDDDGQGSIAYNLDSNATWLNINPITGVLSGTPGNSHVGWVWVNVTVTDGNGGIDFVNYSITVSNVNDPPIISTIDVITVTEDNPYSVDYEAIDIDPTQDTLIWSLQTDASWLAFNSSTGVLSGTPTNWEVGSYWVNVSVSDGKGGLDYTNFTLDVIEENDPPQIISSDIEFALEDSFYEMDYNYTDIDDPTVTWILDTNASWLTIDPSTGILNGTPDNSHVGWYWVNVTVDDGRGGIDFTNFTLWVNNTLPLITTIADEFVFEDQYHLDDFDCSDDLQGNVTYSLSTNASWLAINPQTGEINGTANNTQVGWYWVNVTVDDGNEGFDFVYYIIAVNNTIPTITTSPSTNAFEDSEYLQDFDCEDDRQGIIIYSLKTNALWLSIDPQTGIVSGTCENDDVGSYWINISVTDGNGGEDFLNYTLNAFNTNDPPEIITQWLEYIDEDSPYFIDFEYTDIDLDSVAWSINTNATWLSIDTVSGELTGTPRNSHVGMFFVNVSANDGNGGADYVYFTIIVNNTNDLPTIPQLLIPVDDSGINTTYPTFSWSAAADPDVGDSVAYYVLEYSTSSDFTENLTTISYYTNTSYTPTKALADKTVYYWRVQSVDTNFAESGFQATHFVFSIDSGYFAPSYIGRLKSTLVEVGGVWQIDLDDQFELGSVTQGLTFTCNSDEIQIDPVTHIATWKPKDKDDVLTDVTFTVSDGETEVSSFPIDLSVQSEITIWERIFWPYSLIPLILMMLLAGAITVKKWKNRPFVEEVFFISENGRLISHASVSTDEEVDEDILSGMLTGVKDLITDAFVKDKKSRDSKGLHKLEFGDSNIMLEKGNHFFIALVFKGVENRAMFRKIKRAISEIETRYGSVLADWDGDMDSFEGADLIIHGLLSIEILSDEEKRKIKDSEGDKEEKIIEKWSTQMMDSVDDDSAGYGYEEGAQEGYEEEYEEGTEDQKRAEKHTPSEDPNPPPKINIGKLNRIK